MNWWSARLLDLAAWLDRGVWTRLGYDAEFWLAEAIRLPRTDAYLRYNEVYLAASTNSPVAGEYRRIWPDNKTCVVWDGWTPGRYV